MPKLNLPTVQSGYYTSTALNAIFEQIELELDRVLYRNNPVGTPNSMANDIDMNSNDVLNGGSAHFNEIFLEGIDLKSWIASVSFDFFEVVEVTESLRHIGRISDHYKYFTVDKDSEETVFVLAPLKPGVTIIIRNNGYGPVTIQGEPGVIINSPSTANVRTAGGTVVVIAMPSGSWDLVGDVVPQYPGDGG